MGEVAREEIDALAALRESEYAHRKRVLRKEGASKERRDVQRCKRRLVRAHQMREELFERDPPCATACPDLVHTFVVYDTVVSASDIQSLRDVQRTLSAAARKTSRPSRTTPRCVLPSLLAGPLATLQNISAREHAVVSLLLRWMLNRRPRPANVRIAAKKLGVAQHVDLLLGFLTASAS